MYLKTRDGDETHRSSGNQFKKPKSPATIARQSSTRPTPRNTYTHRRPQGAQVAATAHQRRVRALTIRG